MKTQSQKNCGHTYVLLKKVFAYAAMLLILFTFQTAQVKAQFGTNPCMGAATTKLNLSTSTLISGTAGTVGVKYRFANAYVGTPVANSIDVIAELVAIQYGTTVYNNTRYTYNHDVPQSTIGVDGNFQPSFISSTGATNFLQPANTNENLFSTWKFSFVLNSNNTIPIYLPMIAQVIDNDGLTPSGTSPSIRESVSSITNPTAATTAATTQETYTAATKTFLGPAVNQPGIGVGTDFIGYYYYNNVSNITLRFNHNIFVGASDLNTTGSNRYSSVHFGCDYAGTPNFVLQSISGNVYNDANGATDNSISGAGTNGASTLYAILYDNTTGNVLATSTVSAGGTYSFAGITPGEDYTVYLSTTPATVGQTAIPTLTSPGGYVYAGEFFGTGAGTDGTANGILALGVVNATATNANFAIDQIPVANNYTMTAQANPGGTTTVKIPVAAFTGNDPEDGVYATGLNGKKVTLNPATNGTLFYNGVAVSVSTTITNFDPALLTLDPAGATATAITPTFSFSVFDAANQPSAPKTISIPLGAPTTISGNIFNDPNGNAVQNAGENGTNASGLNAVLTDASGNVIETVAVSAGGVYTFTKATASTNYNVVLSTTTPTTGTVLTVSSLPTPATGNWVNTGVNPGGVSPNIGNTTGILAVTTPSTGNVTNQNFAIEQTPATTNFTATAQANPGGTLTVKIPAAAFTGNDATEGAYTPGLNGRKVTLNPATNGTLYYNGIAVNSSTTITNFDPALVTIDPAGSGTGAVTPTFTYSVFDAADKPSAPATISMAFGPGIVLSGTIFDDANGNAIQNAGENGTNAGGLFAVLTDVSGNVIESVAVSLTGTYTFTNATSSAAYNVVLSTTSASVGAKLTASSLPTPATGAWVNTGVNPSGASPTTANVTGILSVNTPAAGNVTNQNFAIEQLPISNTQSYNIATPTGNSFLTLNGTGGAGSPGPLTGSDAEDQPASGSLSTKNIQITMLPSNANELWYNGAKILFGADGINPPSGSNPLTISNYNPSLLQIRFTGTGSMTTTFNYRFVDAAGKPSGAAAAYTVSWLGVLPVNLISFNAEEINGATTVRWTVENENNTNNYVIERGVNGVDFNDRGNVIATNNTSLHSYLYKDGLADVTATTVYYRLRIQSNNGTVKYSSIVKVQRNAAIKKSIAITSNPVTEGSQLRIITDVNANAAVSIYATNGQLVYKFERRIYNGINNISLNNPTTINKGVYILSAIINGEKFNTKVIF